MSLYAATAADDHLPATACFSVQARAEPGVMPRVLELFAKRGLVPQRWHSAAAGTAPQRPRESWTPREQGSGDHRWWGYWL